MKLKKQVKCWDTANGKKKNKECEKLTKKLMLLSKDHTKKKKMSKNDIRNKMLR